MNDDVKQSSVDRYAVSQAYRWRAERDAARQELEKVKSKQPSMISDEERRKVARRLRELAPGSDWPRYVAEACGMDVSKMSGHFHTYTAQLCQRLADLIEPEPERTCRNSDCASGLFTCSECGEITPYTLYWVDFDDGCSTVKSHRPLFCSNCGTKVVEDAD